MKELLFSILVFMVVMGASGHSAPLFSDKPDCVRTDDMPERYRMQYYRGATPECVPNATTINTEELQQLITQTEPVLLDVHGAMSRTDPDFGHEWLIAAPRQSLPNTVWLPNVGEGTLSSDVDHYFRTHIARLTQEDKQKPLVVFCVADCWMSWNAAQRLREYDYETVYWYKLGTDGWAEAGLDFVDVEPEPMPVKLN